MFLIDFFVPPSVAADPLARTRSRNIVKALLFTSLVGGAVVAIYLFSKDNLSPLEVFFFLGCAFTPVFGSLLIRLGVSFRNSLTITNIMGVLFLTGTAYYAGGITSPTTPWFLANLAILATFGDKRTIIAVNLTLISALLFLFFVEDFGFPPVHTLPRDLHDRLFLLSMVSAVLLIGIGSIISLRGRQKTRKILNQALVEAQAGSQAKSEFLSTMSHELRTPLTSIIGALGLLTGGKANGDEEQLSRMVDIAYSNSKRLTYLINDILDIEKIENGQLEMGHEPMSLNDLIVQCVKDNTGYFTQYGVTAKIEDQTQNCRVLGDANRLSQVMANLLSNAAKFAPNQSVIQIGIERNREFARVSVTNFGPVIPEEFWDKVFDRFAQADSSDTRKVGGVGLGLNISKAIIERHNGTIGFTSHEENGTCFYFTVPLATDVS